MSSDIANGLFIDKLRRYFKKINLTVFQERRGRRGKGEKEEEDRKGEREREERPLSVREQNKNNLCPKLCSLGWSSAVVIVLLQPPECQNWAANLFSNNTISKRPLKNLQRC